MNHNNHKYQSSIILLQKRKIESSTGALSIKVLITFVLQLNYKRYPQNGQLHI